ncbi:hypothetical protein, unlikely [Trypanosoma congolense IL3000]|uniref:Peptidase C51 domain-containing protein n=1 Tax=Trypanosoma congolense (strain IL3000) TaxID=1068625 RepID=F9WCZ2_TRYCI|nr:hypothetical protein, unlikely [Trypanosoma congolense IL3000]
MTWQCIEFVRRYWMMQEIPVVLPSVRAAGDFWSETNAHFANGTAVVMEKYKNSLSLKDGGSAPRVHDLLIYPKQLGNLVFGHVAVIVRVSGSYVYVAEQNWNNRPWPPPFHNFSRRIPLRYDGKSDAYRIEEANGVSIRGWIRLKLR